MRNLTPAPRAFVDPTTRAPALGSFAGPLPRIDLGGIGLADRALRRKKWFYLAITSEEVWISLAVVRMGYATSAFAFVFDLESRRMLVDRTIVGPPRAAEIGDDPHAAGAVARFGFGKTSIALEHRENDTSGLRACFAGLDLDVSLDASSAPPAIAAIAQLGPSLVSATEKRVLAKVHGSVVVSGRRIVLDGALGGWDYTHGLMPRHTRWKWAFAMGRARDGAHVAFNVVEGFVGEAECAAFRAGGVFPIHEPRFDFDAVHPERPWRLVGDGMDLTFDVGAVHEQRTNLVLVRSRFLQPAGTFRGTVRIDGREVELDGVPGVVEDQDVLW
ncbi:MAG: hypothetical protein K0S65_4096 [Labilithrix sp.]|nr:hypothetical protein [Labilithrix sp.]